MGLSEKNKIVKLRAVIAALFFCALLIGFFYPRFIASGAVPELKDEVARIKESPAVAAKYSKFPHSKHRRKACSSCHKFPSANWKTVRKDPFPDITDYPKHQSCLSCHRRQFFGSARPAICTICHTNPSPRNSRRNPFPNPREVFDKSPKGKNAQTQFAISFAHEIHVGLVGGTPVDPGDTRRALFVKATFRKAVAEESCAVCHQTLSPLGDSDEEYISVPPKDLGDAFWLKKGTFKSTPTGHTTCFTCHSADSGISPSPQDCATCHKPKPKQPASDFDAKVAEPMKISDKIMLTAWRKRDSSAKFAHEFFAHVEMDCATCHSVDSINTLAAATKKVKISSCAMCHVTATSDDGGILNFEVDAKNADPKFQCVKCHIAYGKLEIPESHLKAIAEQ